MKKKNCWNALRELPPFAERVSNVIKTQRIAISPSCTNLKVALHAILFDIAAFRRGTRCISSRRVNGHGYAIAVFTENNGDGAVIQEFNFGQELEHELCQAIIKST